MLDSGPTETTFTQKNLEHAFGGVLRHISLSGSDLHDDDDPRSLTVITDDERAAFYGHQEEHTSSAPKPAQTRRLAMRDLPYNL